MNRRGFTLIELIVVIAILAILASLAAGTYFRIRAAQQVTSTEQSLVQLSTGLERLWSAARDQAEKEFSTGNLPYGNNLNTLVNFCGGASEKPRAKAVWMYLRMKQEFPQTFMEAHTDIRLLDPNGGGTILFLPRKSTFTSKVPNASIANADNANAQAAVLLYLILTEKGVRGETFSTETVSARTSQIVVNGQTFTVFTDSWGTALSYGRFLRTPDLSNPPFLRNPNGIATTALTESEDPFDVNNRCSNEQRGPGALPVWPINNPRANAFFNTLGITPGAFSPQRIMQTRGWTPTIVSAGPNRSWDAFNVRDGGASDGNIGIIYFDTTGATSDNLLSYRLRQFGARGD